MSEEAQNASPTPAPEPAPAAHADASTNVSQAQVAQMTASSAPPGENGKWSCEVCTYENFPLSRKCTMCRAPKTCLNENIFKLQDDASALPTQDVCGAEAVAERLKPLRISSPQGPAAACSVVKWPCPTCTYENWPKALKCAMCGAAGPPAPAAPAPAAAPAPPNNKHIGINDICNSQAAPEAEGRRSKRRNNNIDWIWLQACLGVVEGDPRCVDAYLASGGDPARALTPHEVALLNRASAFDAGHTLVHLAIRFQRQDILSTLLSRISGGGPGLKRSPSYIAPDLAAAIRRHMAGCVRHKKGSFPCRYINELSTFALPAEIEELPAAIQEQLFSELLDRDAQQTLEAEPPLINWSHELSVTLGSRLYALWNRSAGDCLPDAVCQAAYGVFDRHNALRAALADSLHHAHRRTLPSSSLHLKAGRIVKALDKKWHPEHFTCNTCRKPIDGAKFHQHDGGVHCVSCFAQHHSPRCHGCGEPITDRVIQALGVSWHAHHFVCGGCRKELGGGGFMEQAGRPYCSSCYADKFAARCQGCSKPIVDKAIIALDAKWHRECFTCNKCRNPVTDSTFSVMDNKPLCGKCA